MASNGIAPPDPPGVHLRLARERAGLTQLQLATRARVAPSTISRLESGARPMMWTQLCTLLAILDLQPTLRLEPLDAHLDRALQAQRDVPAHEWLVDVALQAPSLFRVLSSTQLVVDGALAARLFGLPVPVSHVTLTIADDEDSLRELHRVTQQQLMTLQPAGEHTWEWNRFGLLVRVRVVSEPAPSTRLTATVFEDSFAVRVTALDRLRLTASERRLLGRALLQERDRDGAVPSAQEAGDSS